MNLGHDFKAALKAAKEDQEIRQVHFISPASMATNSAESRACTAPGLREAHGHPKADVAPKPNSPTSTQNQHTEPTHRSNTQNTHTEPTHRTNAQNQHTEPTHRTNTQNHTELTRP